MFVRLTNRSSVGCACGFGFVCVCSGILGSIVHDRQLRTGGVTSDSFSTTLGIKLCTLVRRTMFVVNDACVRSMVACRVTLEVGWSSFRHFLRKFHFSFTLVAIKIVYFLPTLKQQEHEVYAQNLTEKIKRVNEVTPFLRQDLVRQSLKISDLLSVEVFLYSIRYFVGLWFIITRI